MEVKGNVLPSMNMEEYLSQVYLHSLKYKQSNYFDIMYTDVISAVAMIRNSKMYPTDLRKYLRFSACYTVGQITWFWPLTSLSPKPVMTVSEKQFSK